MQNNIHFNMNQKDMHNLLQYNVHIQTGGNYFHANRLSHYVYSPKTQSHQNMSYPQIILFYNNQNM